VPSEWIDEDIAVRRICAILGVDRDNARLRLAQSVGAGRVRTRGRVSGGQWRPIGREWWRDADDWIYYGLSEFTEIEFNRPDLLELYPAPPAPSTHTSKGRPAGRSYAKADAPLVIRMQELIASGHFASPSAAAWEVIGRDGKGAIGKGTPDSKVIRLVRRLPKNN
jgi:hypothetical protein